MITYQLLDQQYLVHSQMPYSIAIEQSFDTQQPNHFGAEYARKTPMHVGSFIGDTERGGSCNVNELFLNPHCNGTHTETIGHICDSSHELSLSIAQLALPPLMPCVLITIEPELANTSGDSYAPKFTSADQIISRAALVAALADYTSEQLQALVLRTLPNLPSKASQHYHQQQQPAFFSREAILYLNELGVEHLLVDFPSLDRMHDDGLLTCHHIFWQVTERTHQANQHSLLHKTITELIYVEQQISDGFYFLSLQTPALATDATPSRPVLYAAEQITNLPL
jgi:kynurenine formamidase